MKPRIFRLGSGLMVAAALSSGVAAVFSGPGDLWAQTSETTIKCWLESCTGNSCVRVEIECPKPVKIVPST